MDAQYLWQTAIERLEEQLQPTVCPPCFAETAAFSLVDDVLVVGVRSLSTETPLIYRYNSPIRKILAEIVGRAIDVNYIILPELFEDGELSPKSLRHRLLSDLDIKKILILIEKKDASYVGYAPDVPNSFVTGESREEVVQRIRQAVQDQLSPIYEKRLPLSKPQITAEYIDITRSTPDSSV